MTVPFLCRGAFFRIDPLCADWFAVVALFRPTHPVHRNYLANQALIGQSPGRFITNNFLTQETINRKLVEIDIAGAFARWLGAPAHP